MTWLWLCVVGLLLAIIVGLMQQVIRDASSDRCYRGGRRHCFEPRYDEVQVPRPITGDYQGPAGGIRSINMQQVYVRDVCIWCGASADRPQVDPGPDAKPWMKPVRSNPTPPPPLTPGEGG
jgi:hypothetical protein